jgi:hypothetical protein
MAKLSTLQPPGEVTMEGEKGVGPRAEAPGKSQSKAPRTGGAFLDEEKSSVGRADGRTWETVLRLW